MSEGRVYCDESHNELVGLMSSRTKTAAGFKTQSVDGPFFANREVFVFAASVAFALPDGTARSREPKKRGQGIRTGVLLNMEGARSVYDAVALADSRDTEGRVDVGVFANDRDADLADKFTGRVVAGMDFIQLVYNELVESKGSATGVDVVEEVVRRLPPTLSGDAGEAAAVPEEDVLTHILNG